MSSPMKFSEYLQLPLQKQEELRDIIKRSGFRLSSIVSMDFDWLKEGDFESNRWVVEEAGQKETIHWDSTFPAPLKRDDKKKIILGKSRRLSDNPLLIEDLKTLFVVTKITKPDIDMSLDNASGCRQFAYSLKRYAIEAMTAPFMLNPSQITKRSFNKLLDGASSKQSVTLKYAEILERYFDDTSLDDIPIKFYEGNQSPPSIDVSHLKEKLGVDDQVYRQDDNVKSIIGQKELELKAALGIENFKVRYENALTKTEYKTKTSQVQYRQLLSAVEGARKAYKLLPHLFNYELAPYTFNRKELLSTQDFSEKQGLAGRTRDIPPMLFLEMMDAAARFVLDYSDELFEAEEYLRGRHDYYVKKGLGARAISTNTNNDARNWKREDTRKHSPFPLGAYKQAQKGIEASKRYPEEVANLIAEAILQGDKASVTRERFKLTKPQYDSLRRRTILATKSDGISLQQAIYQYLIFSCTIIIFALTARRENEVFGLKAGCVSRDAEDKLWIDSYVAKTLQDDYKFTTVTLVEKAVKILERISEPARKKLNTDSLFVYDDTFERAPRNLNRINNIAERFFDFIGIERDENGEHWKLSEHQFRRFFAVMYFYHYESANCDALMHEFQHVDWSMTEVYLTLKVAGKMKQELNEANRSVMNDRIFDYIIKEGVGGAMLPRLKAVVMDTVSFVPDAPKFRKRAVSKIKEQNYIIDFIDTGICFGAKPSLAKKCNCYDSSSDIAMIHKASEEMCRGCPAQLTVPEIAKGQIKLLDDDGESDILKEVCNECSR